MALHSRETPPNNISGVCCICLLPPNTVRKMGENSVRKRGGLYGGNVPQTLLLTLAGVLLICTPHTIQPHPTTPKNSYFPNKIPNSQPDDFQERFQFYNVILYIHMYC